MRRRQHAGQGDRKARAARRCRRDPSQETDGQLIGIVTDRDIACRSVGNGADISGMTAKDVMTPNAACCSPEDDIATAIAIMERRQIRRLPVTNGHNALLGMLSLGDISHKVEKSVSGEALRAVSAHHPS